MQRIQKYRGSQKLVFFLLFIWRRVSFCQDFINSKIGKYFIHSMLGHLKVRMERENIFLLIENNSKTYQPVINFFYDSFSNNLNETEFSK